MALTSHLQSSTHQHDIRGGLTPPTGHRNMATTVSEYEQQSMHSSAPPSRAQTPFDFIPIEEGNVYTYSHLAGADNNQPHYLLHEKPPPESHMPQYIVPDQRMPKVQPRLSRRGMDILVRSCGDARHYNAARAHSPSMNNEEPIMLSTYPAGAPADDPAAEPKIERMDFPAPPFYYASKTREREVLANGEDEEEELDPDEAEELRREADRLQREEQMLESAATGIGKTFLKDLHEREKMRSELSEWKLSKFRDPRNRSRDPSAKRPPKTPLKYAGTIAPFASPSRLEDRPRLWEDWSVDDEQQQMLAMGGGRPSSTTGASILPQYCGLPQQHAAPKSSTLPTGVLLATTPHHHSQHASRAGSAAPPSHQQQQYNTKGPASSVSAAAHQQHYVAPGDHRAYTHSPLPVHEVDWRKSHSADYYGDSASVPDRYDVVGGRGGGGPGLMQSSHVREMSPSMPAILPPIVKSTIAEPYYRSEFFEQVDAPDLENGFEPQRPKYRAEVLYTTNRNLPEDVDHKNLERHLTLEEFIDIFDMPPEEFYMQPLWKRNDMKKRGKNCFEKRCLFTVSVCCHLFRSTIAPSCFFLFVLPRVFD